MEPAVDLGTPATPTSISDIPSGDPSCKRGREGELSLPASTISRRASMRGAHYLHLRSRRGISPGALSSSDAPSSAVMHGRKWHTREELLNTGQGGERAANKVLEAGRSRLRTAATPAADAATAVVMSRSRRHTALGRRQVEAIGIVPALESAQPAKLEMREDARDCQSWQKFNTLGKGKRGGKKGKRGGKGGRRRGRKGEKERGKQGAKA